MNSNTMTNVLKPKKILILALYQLTTICHLKKTWFPRMPCLNIMIEKAFSVDGYSITCVGSFMSCLSPYKSKISGRVPLHQRRACNFFLPDRWWDRIPIKHKLNISIVEFYLITSPSLCWATRDLKTWARDVYQAQKRKQSDIKTNMRQMTNVNNATWELT